MRKRTKVIFIVICILLGTIFFTLLNKTEEPLTMEYSELLQLIEIDSITEIELNEINSSAQVIDEIGKQYLVKIPDARDFSQYIREKVIQGSDVKFISVANQNNILSVIFSLLPNILFIVILIVLYRKMGILGDSMSISPIQSNITFEDIAGLDEEIEQVKSVVNFLKNPEAFENAGAKIPKGILFHGNPGTGKTLLAKAIAGESGVPFFAMSASNFEEKFVGVGASRIRSLFRKARECAPCIIFIDEIDSLIKDRYSERNNGLEQTLNQFLSEVDGIGEESNIVIIGATNHKEVLDEAAIRAGRFNKHIYIPVPNKSARELILRVHARDKKLADNVSLNRLAEKTVGFTGADLANILNEAAILSVTRKSNIISQDDIDEAVAIILLGVAKKSDNADEITKKIVAVHEAGHALIAKINNPDVEIYEISIVCRGRAAGYTLVNHPDSLFLEKEKLLLQIDELLGGRIAEEIILQEISSGAQNDLQRVSEIAYQMVYHYGMGKHLLTLTGKAGSFDRTIEEQSLQEVEKIIQKEAGKVRRLLGQNKEVLEKLAERLQQNQRLNREDLKSFFQEVDI